MTPCTGNLKLGKMEFGEMKRNSSNWSNFCMLPRRAGSSASAGLSCWRLLDHTDLDTAFVVDCCRCTQQLSERSIQSHTGMFGVL